MKTPFLLLAALPLAGCISFAAKPPASLLTLDTQASVPVGQDQNSATAKAITIQVPAVPQSLATARIPVQATPTSIAYVKSALWAEPPARLFARLLSDTMTARTGRVVLSGAQSAVDPGARLSGELRTFGLDAGQNQAVVIFDASLIRLNATTVEKQRFEAHVPVAAIDGPNAATGISAAANQVAQQVADWVGR
ncbi:ABC-type transport auxiliary lipoprotein family protein [uncultured Sphingomonas sp.]|uniref:ABC-type transport auxiliary lipoprotein family protein n=1 Tax=uncultured Sphingomonas sp. TaxID=158754 RepID=UPI0035C9AEE8